MRFANSVADHGFIRLTSVNRDKIPTVICNGSDILGAMKTTAKIIALTAGPLLTLTVLADTVTSIPTGQVIDLTHAYDSDTVYWPTADGFELTVDFKGMTEGGWYYEANTFRTAEHGGTHLDAPIHFAEGTQQSAISQLRMGLRFAGTVEFAGLDAEPNYARADNVLNMGRDVIADLDPGKATEVTQWMGRRPSLPDHMPVIGQAPGFSNTWLAFGHQHVGLSLGARTGSLIADLIRGNEVDCDLAPFRADRF